MNRIKTIVLKPDDCPCVEGKDKIEESYDAYLSDESRIESATVEALYFPETTAQVVDAVSKTRAAGDKIIVSGSRTGITGGAIGVEGCAIISLEKMNTVLGDWRFQAGVRLEDIPETSSEYYPVDPTEMTASLGGTVSTDASGARSFFYGSTRKHIKGLTVVLSDGFVLEVKRGDVTCEAGEFIIETDTGELVVSITDVAMPDVKHAAGYYMKSDMDLIDLFIGCEGTLGIVTEIEVQVSAKPEDRLFLVVFADSEEHAIDLVEAVKANDGLKTIAIEYFDPNAIELLRTVEDTANIPDSAICAVYLELMVDEEIEETLDAVLTGCGLDMDATWAGFEEKDLQAMKHFRHTVPETVNSIIGKRQGQIPGLHKIGTDTSVPEGRLREFLSFVRDSIEGRGVEYVIFGHVGDNHLHINMIPGTLEELEAAKELYLLIAQKSVELGGSVSAEHGIGRLKKHFMHIQFNETDLKAMRAVKDALDPEWILNPGVMFD